MKKQLLGLSFPGLIFPSPKPLWQPCPGPAVPAWTGNRASLDLQLHGEMSLPGRAPCLITATAIRCHKSIRSLLFLGGRAAVWDRKNGVVRWPLGWHLGDRDAPGRGDELWLLGGHHVSFMIPQSSLEATILLPPADLPVTSWVSCPGAGDRQEVAPGSFCGTLVPSITCCGLLHRSKGSGCSRGRCWCLAQHRSSHCSQCPPVSSQCPGEAQG